jgi:hypothetical protein
MAKATCEILSPPPFEIGVSESLSTGCLSRNRKCPLIQKFLILSTSLALFFSLMHSIVSFELSLYIAAAVSLVFSAFSSIGILISMNPKRTEVVAWFSLFCFIVTMGFTMTLLISIEQFSQIQAAINIEEASSFPSETRLSYWLWRKRIMIVFDIIAISYLLDGIISCSTAMILLIRWTDYIGPLTSSDGTTRVVEPLPNYYEIANEPPDYGETFS